MLFWHDVALRLPVGHPLGVRIDRDYAMTGNVSPDVGDFLANLREFQEMCSSLHGRIFADDEEIRAFAGGRWYAYINDDRTSVVLFMIDMLGGIYFKRALGRGWIFNDATYQTQNILGDAIGPHLYCSTSVLGHNGIVLEYQETSQTLKSTGTWYISVRQDETYGELFQGLRDLRGLLRGLKGLGLAPPVLLVPAHYLKILAREI